MGVEFWQRFWEINQKQGIHAHSAVGPLRGFLAPGTLNAGIVRAEGIAVHSRIVAQKAQNVQNAKCRAVAQSAHYSMELWDYSRQLGQWEWCWINCIAL